MAVKRGMKERASERGLEKEAVTGSETLPRRQRAERNGEPDKDVRAAPTWQNKEARCIMGV